MYSKVAGVTFNNEKEDGGRSRQEILKELIDLNRHIITVNLVYTEYEGEFAIKVNEKSTGQTIGYIPKKDLDRVKNSKTKQMTGFIRNYGQFCVQLDSVQQPTHNQYMYMKSLCAHTNHAMPAYDKRAYSEIFALAELKVEK